MTLENDHRYIVSIGTFKTEQGAIARQRASRQAGFVTDIIDTTEDATANIYAAILLIAEQLQALTKALAQTMTDELKLAEPKPEPDTRRVEIGRKIAEARRNRGLSQTELGKLCDCAYNTISKAEAGSSAVSDDLLKKICAYLKIKEG